MDLTWLGLLPKAAVRPNLCDSGLEKNGILIFCLLFCSPFSVVDFWQVPEKLHALLQQSAQGGMMKFRGEEKTEKSSVLLTD